jgi:hypothetical protein
MVDCNICYNDISYGVRCFGKCNIVICHNCFVKLLKINICDSIEFNCPQCRHTSIKNKDERFTKFINKNRKCLKQVVQLFEDKLEQTNVRRLSNTWEAFSRRVNQEQEIYPIIYFDYDDLIPNG